MRSLANQQTQNIQFSEKTIKFKKYTPQQSIAIFAREEILSIWRASIFGAF